MGDSKGTVGAAKPRAILSLMSLQAALASPPFIRVITINLALFDESTHLSLSLVILLFFTPLRSNSSNRHSRSRSLRRSYLHKRQNY
jgi:hypothetical protein